MMFIGTGLIVWITNVTEISVELTNHRFLHDIASEYPVQLCSLINDARNSYYDEVAVIKAPSYAFLADNPDAYMPELRKAFGNNRYPQAFYVWPQPVSKEDIMFIIENLHPIFGIPVMLDTEPPVVALYNSPKDKQ